MATEAGNVEITLL